MTIASDSTRSPSAGCSGPSPVARRARCVRLAVGLLAMWFAQAAGATGLVSADVPPRIDPAAKYLFYLHGLALEQGGPRAAAYDYAGILSALAERGFVVIGEQRGRVRNDAYAERVAGQVRTLLGAGVPPANITVAGHSKGGMIALLVMASLAEPGVGYVSFAGCGLPGSGFEGHLRFAEHRAPAARGELLSAYDASDRIAGSCRQALDRMGQARVTERVLDIGGGHELFYRPEAAWLDVLQGWAEARR